MSTKVLTADTRSRDPKEPDGSAATLFGKIDPKSFGSRVQYAKPASEDPKKCVLRPRGAVPETRAVFRASPPPHARISVSLTRRHRRTKKGGDDEAALRPRKARFSAASSPRLRPDAHPLVSPQRAAAGDVLSLGSELLYRPKTRETRAAYEALLSQLASSFGDVPADVLRGACDEVLATLKGDGVTDPDKKRAVESLLGPVSSEKMAHLVAIGKLITDWYAPGEAAAAAGGEALDDDIGVAVEFEEESDGDADGEARVVVDEEEEEDGEGGGAGADDAAAPQPLAGVETDGGAGAARAAAKEEGKGGLAVGLIDAFWLQREVSKACGFGASDAEAGAAMAKRVLEALDAPDDRAAEGALVALLDYDKFDLIKLLLHNRAKVLWCTRLARAQDAEEAKRIEAAMAGAPETAAVLRQLGSQRMSARERQNATEDKIREEARRLRAGEAEAGGGGGAVDDDGAPAAAPDRPGLVGAAAGRRLLELDALSFQAGRRLMANKRCELPPGSYRSAKKGYEEVHVPALKPKPFGDAEKLVKVADLPEWAQPAFEGMKTLNRVQSRVVDCALLSAENLLLCAPTGAGKTNVAVLTILHEVGLHRGEDGVLDLSSFKIVYVAPMKALVAEVVGNLSKRLASYGMTVAELTGDVSMSKAQIEATQVIVTTPEKWDIITRKSGDRTYTQLVRLLIIDEVHLLHDDRGPVLEAIVARTVRNVEATQEMTRLVGLSATLPNFEDVAAFMRVSADKGLFVFDNSFRPCPLQQQYIGITAKKALQRHQLMNDICYEKVLEGAGKHQTLVFVHSRKETAKTARFMRDAALNSGALERFVRDDSASREVLKEEAATCKSAELRDLLPHGFAIHHAGMARSDRTLVEDLFADGHVQVLVSTATLAWGVNLPAHTVIIKGTQVYNPEKAAWDELSPMDVMQCVRRRGATLPSHFFTRFFSPHPPFPQDDGPRGAAAVRHPWGGHHHHGPRGAAVLPVPLQPAAARGVAAHLPAGGRAERGVRAGHNLVGEGRHHMAGVLVPVRAHAAQPGALRHRRRSRHRRPDAGRVESGPGAHGGGAARRSRAAAL